MWLLRLAPSFLHCSTFWTLFKIILNSSFPVDQTCLAVTQLHGLLKLAKFLRRRRRWVTSGQDHAVMPSYLKV